MFERKIRVIGVVGLVVLVLGGCAEAPQQDIEDAQAALAAAEMSEAATYAPERWIAAQDALTRAEAEVQAQEQRFVVLRSYDQSTALMNQARDLADLARSEADMAKESARQGAVAALDAVRNDLQLTVELLADAPRGKDTRAEIESMQQELAGLQAALDEATRLIGEEQFLEAQAQSDQVNEKLIAIRTDLENAMAKVVSQR